MKSDNKIILALDVETEEEAFKVCSEVRDYIDAIKVGYPLVLNAGIEIISKLKGFGKPIMADFKVADIPAISAKICKTAMENGADYVIIHGFVGEDVIRECAKIAKLFVVCEMTHEGAREFLESSAEEVAEIAKKYAYGIVAPATRPERIIRLRELVGDLVIISPGIKAQGAEVGDAIKSGADFEIIGRGIYEAADPRTAARKYSEILKRL